MPSKSRKKIKPKAKSRNKMQPKLKAGGIRLRIRFLNLHLIINGDLVIAKALILVIITVLSLVIIMMMRLLVFG